MSKPTVDPTSNSKAGPAVPVNFLRPIIQADLDSGKHTQIVTRFPPEPNGYLHIGHAKSICVNFGLAQEFGGVTHLRFYDTNPAKEDQEYIDAIESDIKWLGFEWSGEVRYASQYFDQLHDWAVELIKAGKAYVDDLSPEQAKEYRGSLTEPGKNSPFRDRSVEENLDWFARMKAGEFQDGARVLRAKIDMASPNMNLRDPIMYRIRHAHHHQTGDKWCIYPNYDFTHGQSDAIEGITHSICTLEFESHRPLYEWFLDSLPVPAHPRQYEFSRLNLNYTITSKRKLKQLVDEKHVFGWDDPRMSTLSGFRRRGYTPKSIRNFCDMVGTNRSDGVVDFGMLEFSIRQDLDQNAPRAMCVLLKVMIDNWRWVGVPFYLRTGKRMSIRDTEIVICFKHAPYAQFRDTEVDELKPTYLKIQIQPNEGMWFDLLAKKPGPTLEMANIELGFDYKDFFEMQPSTGYETLIYDCMTGDQTLFQRADNIENGWRAVQPFLDAWQQDASVQSYPAEEDGPQAAEDLLTRDGRVWHGLG